VQDAEEPVMQAPDQDDPLEAAARRLDRSLSLLEARVAESLREAQASAGGLFDQDRAKLAAELDSARARERELQEAGADAAKALGRAITEIRAALGEDAAATVLNEEA
jgi:hypothetical protein